MFCSRCGKRVLDSMLFCPFCGAKIIIPDQDPEIPMPTPAEPEKKAVQLTYDDTAFHWDEPTESTEAGAAPEPEPVEAEETEPTPSPVSKPSGNRVCLDKPEPDLSTEEALPKAPEYLFEANDPVIEPAPVPASWADAAPRTDTDPDPLPNQSEWRDFSSSRFKPQSAPRPVKAPDLPDQPLDMYLDGNDEDDFDAFEAAQKRRPSGDRRRRGRSSRQADDDDDAKEGFLIRHIRGIVTTVLLLVLLAAAGLYALSDPGQIALAKLNLPLPLKAEIYVKLGYESYQAGEFAQAGAYYERALAREPGSYDYASSAAMAYISDKNTEKAAAMLEKCVALKPNAVEPYIYLLNLYPNTATRPIRVTELLEQGYLYTGDERLKQS